MSEAFFGKIRQGSRGAGHVATMEVVLTEAGESDDTAMTGRACCDCLAQLLAKVTLCVTERGAYGKRRSPD